MKTYKVTEYLNFTVVKDSGKTLTVEVGSNSGVKLGCIKWIAAWRKYGFFPLPDLQFDVTCLLEITGEITAMMERRGK